MDIRKIKDLNRFKILPRLMINFIITRLIELVGQTAKIIEIRGYLEKEAGFGQLATL